MIMCITCMSMSTLLSLFVISSENLLNLQLRLKLLNTYDNVREYINLTSYLFVTELNVLNMQ